MPSNARLTIAAPMITARRSDRIASPSFAERVLPSAVPGRSKATQSLRPGSPGAAGLLALGLRDEHLTLMICPEPLRVNPRDDLTTAFRKVETGPSSARLGSPALREQVGEPLDSRKLRHFLESSHTGERIGNHPTDGGIALLAVFIAE
jgi:hypothetical protein